MVAYMKPQQRKKENGERLRGERDQIKFIDLRFGWVSSRFMIVLIWFPIRLTSNKVVEFCVKPKS